MRVDVAIARCRRDLTLGSVLRWTLLACAFALTLLGSALRLTSGSMVVGIGLIWLIWMALNYLSVRASRLAAGSPSLIAAGNFQAAEEQIDQAILSFSVVRVVKLMSLHYLAVLRHAQRRWQEAAMVAAAVLQQRGAAAGGLSTRSRLLLADSLLELGDLGGAHAAISGLYRQRLTLTEAVNLNVIQTDYQARVGDWQGAMAGIGAKVQLAELLPGDGSAQVQAVLALAARRYGREDWCAWLMRRVELLVDPSEIVLQRRWLAELWPGQSPVVPPDPGRSGIESETR